MTHALQEHTHNKLKIALIVDSKIASKYVYELAEWGQNQNDLEVTHLVIQNIPSNKQSKIHKAFFSLKKNGLFHLAQQVGFTLIEKVESYYYSNTATSINIISPNTIYLIALKTASQSIRLYRNLDLYIAMKMAIYKKLENSD